MSGAHNELRRARIHLDGLVDHVLHARGVAHVHGNRMCLRAGLSDLGLDGAEGGRGELGSGGNGRAVYAYEVLFVATMTVESNYVPA